jgi:hypothetical protein
MPASTEILAPVTALLLLTCVVWVWMYITRIPAIRKAGMNLDPEPGSDDAATWPCGGTE